MGVTTVVGGLLALLVSGPLFISVPLSVTAVGPQEAATAHQSVFTTLDYADAFAKAKADGLVLLIDATAEWCGPCKRMERETWAAQKVIDALAEVALPIQVDVDEEAELARKLGISAMPTLIAVQNGREIDRHVGYLGPEAFLAWFADVRAGVSSQDALLEAAHALQQSDDQDARYGVAQELLAAGYDDRALRHYLWLWETIDDSSSLSGVRISFMASDIGRLAQRHEPAMQAFGAVQQALSDRIASDPSELSDQEWQDWMILSDQLDGGEQVLRWFDAHKVQGTVAMRPSVAIELFQLMVRRDRLADAALLGVDLRSRASFQLGIHKNLRREMGGRVAPEVLEQLIQGSTERLRLALANYYAVALHAGSTEDAEFIAGRLIDTADDPESRMALVSAALATGLPPSPQLAVWLDEAAKRGEPVGQLREELRRSGG